jgi:hypothetical protein
MGYVWGGGAVAANDPLLFIAGDQHIHQVWWNHPYGWNTNDITAGCGCTLPEFGSAMTGYWWNGNAITDYIGIDHTFIKCGGPAANLRTTTGLRAPVGSRLLAAH